MTDHPKPTITVNVDVTNPGRALCRLQVAMDEPYRIADGQLRRRTIAVSMFWACATTGRSISQSTR